MQHASCDLCFVADLPLGGEGRPRGVAQAPTKQGHLSQERLVRAGAPCTRARAAAPLKSAARWRL